MAKQNKNLAQVFHYDLYGKRQDKYNFLDANSISSIVWNELNYKEPYYFFVPKDFELEEKYKKGFKIDELFYEKATGIKTQRDDANIFFTEKERKLIFNDFIKLTENELKVKYKFKDVRDWKVSYAKKDLLENSILETKVFYRTFDIRFMNYTGKTKGIMGYPRKEIMQNFRKSNIGLIATRQISERNYYHIFITKSIIDMCYISNKGKENNYIFPLYLYPDQESDGIFAEGGLTEKGRKPNLNMEIVNQIAEKLGLQFTPEKETTTPSADADTPPCEGGEQRGINYSLSKNFASDLVGEQSGKNSPPDLGGVSEGRGGQDHNTSKERADKIHNLPHLKTFRKQLRHNLTPAEATLWNMLKNKQLKGRKFRRQHSVGNYILDFYCPSEKLAIELDGEGHFQATQEEYDYERNLFLSTFGIKVLRFENKEVFENPEKVLAAIEQEFGWYNTSPVPPSKGGESKGKFAPIDILDYIYAVLHSPTYREKYKEFLKIDFPRVPYPKDKNTFWQLVKLGGELRQIHLLESPKVEQFITSYPIDGDNTITTKISKKDWQIIDTEKKLGRIWINDKQYFDNIPLVAWEFYIGGYQPAQKWLKDRRGRTLSFEDILHYQKIIVALTETDRIMKEIDKIDFD